MSNFFYTLCRGTFEAFFICMSIVAIVIFLYSRTLLLVGFLFIMYLMYLNS